ncbi:MAG TPA: epoxide hydrolase N-terminal domain-containing protein [Streptosporangiaceae bacterium]|jgi:hypothetical protein|nr:epoxide hydrolase N-terminal domain-containing protein [Streptosporangiaceae bacterium]
MAENSTSLEPFTIAVPEDLADLTRRLKATRWARDARNEGQIYGISTSYLKALVDLLSTRRANYGRDHALALE